MIDADRGSIVGDIGLILSLNGRAFVSLFSGPTMKVPDVSRGTQENGTS